VDINLSKLPSSARQVLASIAECPCSAAQRFAGAGDSLFHNNGDGTFTNVSKKAGVSDPEGRYGLGTIWTDADGDGWLDLFVANDATEIISTTNKDGTFAKSVCKRVSLDDDGVPLGSMGVTVGDYLHTGQFGIFITNFSGEHATLYRHDKPLLFTDVSYASKVAPVSTPMWLGNGLLRTRQDGWRTFSPSMACLPANGKRQRGHYLPPAHALISQSARRHLHGSCRRKRRCPDDPSRQPRRRLRRSPTTTAYRRGGQQSGWQATILKNDGGSHNNWVAIKLIGSGKNRDVPSVRASKVASGELTNGMKFTPAAAIFFQ